MAAVGDLSVLGNVKAWLNIDSAQTASDANLALLISAASRFVKQFTSKGVILQSYTETYDGNGKSVLVLRQQPVVSISSLYLDPQLATPIAQSVTGQSGWLIDNNQALRLTGYAFTKGVQNIRVTYKAGYQVLGEAQAVPATPYQINGLTQLGDLWRSDLGVTFADATALALVSGVPATGQYAVTLAGLYTFAAADTGKTVLLSYTSVPRDLEQCVIELVGERYRTKGRIGEASKAQAGETTSYSQKDMNSTVKLMLNQYRTIAPV